MSTKEVASNKLEELRRCIFAGIESWVKAGEIVVELFDTQACTVEDICKEIPGLSKDIVFKFEAIGRKSIFPKLLLSTSAGSRALSRMPIAEQEKYFADPIPVLVSINGEYDILLVKCDDLTPAQCRQVFGNTMRDKAGQRAWIESQNILALRDGQEVDTVPYVVAGGKVRFRKDCILSKRELKQILEFLK